MKKKKNSKGKSKDVLAYLWQDVVQAKKRYFMLACALIVLNVFSYLIVFYYVFLHKERVILIDPTGKPYLAQTYADEGVFKSELHRFFIEVVTLVYEKTYVDFLDPEARSRFARSLRVYFASDEDLSTFLKAYMQSPYVQSLVTNKYITKVGDVSALDVKKEKGHYRAIGKVKVSAYLENDLVQTQYKIVEIAFVKGRRKLSNPFGLYLVGFYERGTEVVK